MNYRSIAILAFIFQVIYLIPSRFSMIDYLVIVGLTLIIWSSLDIQERRDMKESRGEDDD